MELARIETNTGDLKSYCDWLEQWREGFIRRISCKMRCSRKDQREMRALRRAIRHFEHRLLTEEWDALLFEWDACVCDQGRIENA